MDEGGSMDGASLSLKRLRGGELEGNSMGTLEDMLRKYPDTSICFYGGPFPSEGNLVCRGMGLVYRGLR